MAEPNDLFEGIYKGQRVQILSTGRMWGRVSVDIKLPDDTLISVMSEEVTPIEDQVVPGDNVR